MHWYVLTCLAGQELRAARDVCRFGEARVPLELRSTVDRRQRLRQHKAPALRGYVFAQVSHNAWPALRMSSVLTGYLKEAGTVDTPATIPAAMLFDLEAALTAEPARRGLRPGAVVVHRAGAFRGHESVVAALSARFASCRVQLFRQEVLAKVPVHHVEVA